MDVTEIFNQLESEKQTRMFKITFYAIVFIAIIYRLTECAVIIPKPQTLYPKP
jgi:hypothetical protein